MRIALAIGTQVNMDVPRNLRTMEELAYTANQSKVDLLVFGEAFLQGFDGLNFKDFEKDYQIALTETDDYIFRIKMMAVAMDVAIGFGYYEKFEGNIYASYMVIDKDGTVLTNYRRLSEGWKEKFAGSHYREGTQLEVFEFMETKIIVGICGDFWNKGIVQSLEDYTYDLVLWPNFVSYTPKQWLEVELGEYRLQCKHLGQEVILVNSINHDPESMAYGGGFYVVDQKFVVNHPMEVMGISIVDR